MYGQLEISSCVFSFPTDTMARLGVQRGVSKFVV